MTLNEIEFFRRKNNSNLLDDTINLLESEIKYRIRRVAVEKSPVVINRLAEEQNLYSSLLTGLTGVWCEGLLKSLVENSNDFTLAQKQQIFKTSGLKDKWHLAYKAAVANIYQINDNNRDIPSKSFVEDNLRGLPDDLRRFQVLYDYIDRIVPPIADLRNKIQHGEWKHAYIKDSTRNYVFSPTTTLSLEQSNILIERLKRHQIKQIFILILEMSSFRSRNMKWAIANTTPFEKSFDKRILQIVKLDSEIIRVDYDKYVNTLIKKERRGISYRKYNTSLLRRMLKVINK